MSKTLNENRKTLRTRHENSRRRKLVVKEKRHLAPSYLSIIFVCDDFGDFDSLSSDDHVKLFIPGAADEKGKPPMRDYTPRAFDASKKEFVIDFALHDDPGPATAWAIASHEGDTIDIGGPRGSSVIPDNYDWYWLLGDETAIPSVMRRMEEWPDVKMTAVITVAGPQEEVPLPLGPGHQIVWIHRPASSGDDAKTVLDRLAEMPFPDGDGFIWIASEASAVKALREAVLARGHPLTQIKAAGYWTKGMADTTARFE